MGRRGLAGAWPPHVPARVSQRGLRWS